MSRNNSPASIQYLLTEATGRLQHSSASPRLDAEVLMAHAIGRDRTWLFTWPERELDSAQLNHFDQCVRQRSDGVPVAYITGVKEFWSMNFRVSSDTLVPRPDTETLVQLALDSLLQHPGPMLDLGTGSGIIAIAIAKECIDRESDSSRNNSSQSKTSKSITTASGTQASQTIEVSAADNSVCALNIARENAQQLNADVSFYLSDWFAQLPPQRWQLIVSNPPYLAMDDTHLPSLKHEPEQALIAPDNGLGDIRKIITAARDHLLDAGTLMIEHGERQGQQVKSLMESAGYRSVHTETDIANRARVTTGQMP